MNPYSRWVMIAVVLAVLGGAAWNFRPKEEQKIRSAILGMATDVTFNGHEGNFARLAKVQSLAARFTEDAEIHVEQVVPIDAGLRGRESIRQALTAGMAITGAISVRVHDLTVQILDPATARALLTASAKAGQKGEFNAQEFELRLVKKDGRWLVSRVEAVLGYRKPVIQ